MRTAARRASAAAASIVASETLRKSSTKRVSPAILLGPCMRGVGVEFSRGEHQIRSGGFLVHPEGSK